MERFLLRSGRGAARARVLRAGSGRAGARYWSQRRDVQRGGRGTAQAASVRRAGSHRGRLGSSAAGGSQRYQRSGLSGLAAPCHGICRALGGAVGLGRSQWQWRSGPPAGQGSDGRVLPGVHRAYATRPHFHAGRCPAGRRSRDRAESRGLAKLFRRRSGHPEPPAHPRWRALPGDRRSGAGGLRPRRDPFLEAADFHFRPTRHARCEMAFRLRAATRGRHPDAGTGTHGRHPRGDDGGRAQRGARSHDRGGTPDAPAGG